MAKAELNSALKHLRGNVDGLVFKHYSYGLVVTRVPRMDRIKPTPAQRAHRERFRRFGEFHRKVLADPVLKKRYTAIARRKRHPLSAVTLAAFMKQGPAIR